MVKSYFNLPLLIIVFLLAGLMPGEIHAQLMPVNTGGGSSLPGMPALPGAILNQNDTFGNDSTKNKSNEKWVDEQARIYYTRITSEVKRLPDTAIHNYHHFRPEQPWWGRDLGNMYSPSVNLFFTPFQAAGPDLGYHVWDLYTLKTDSLALYNTTRPYTDFEFTLGSKAAQRVSILHTQNITPDWNVAGTFTNVNTPGYYYIQRSTGISGSLSSNYRSKNQRFNTIVGFTYNRFSQDENGGIQSDSFLTSDNYPDPLLIPVNLPESNYGSQRAAVTNRFRNTHLLVQNAYAWGVRDTTYNEDSTKATFTFTPRFRLKHQLQLHSERHRFKDVGPEASRYAFIAPLTFGTTDTVRSEQNWFYVDNKFSLNGYVGKKDKLLAAEAGIGFRWDQFGTDSALLSDKNAFFSNYIFGTIKKEALQEGEWQYGAQAELFFSGQAAGNFNIEAQIAKNFRSLGWIGGELKQTLSNAPYAFTSFNTNFFSRSFSFGKTSITRIGAQLDVSRYRLQAGIRNYVVGNYLYYDTSWNPQQQAAPFSVLQIYGRKQLVYRIFSLDNEVVWQQPTGNAPLRLPAFMLRHVLSVEAGLFKNALQIATGIEARYHTPYYASGYIPYFNQFYFQEQTRISNPVELTLFFNFKVKSFRCFILGDQLQQLVYKRNILNFVGYPAPDAMIRFGFNWVMVN